MNDIFTENNPTELQFVIWIEVVFKLKFSMTCKVETSRNIYDLPKIKITCNNTRIVSIFVLIKYSKKYGNIWQF